MDETRPGYINAGLGDSAGHRFAVLKLTLGGPAASREANRMMAEKMIAFGEAAAKVATGSTAGSVVKGYRKKVRANRRRLTKYHQSAAYSA